MKGAVPIALQTKLEEGLTMDLVIWLPAMFLLGISMMGVCWLFMEACEKI